MRTIVSALALVVSGLSWADETPPKASPDVSSWSTDYVASYKQARLEQKFLLVWFSSDTLTKPEEEFAGALSDESLGESLSWFVSVRVGKSATVVIEGKTLWLLGHASFAHLSRRPGLAIIDLRDPASPHYAGLVSVCPFRGGRPLSQRRFRVLLDLPTGTLTQRTMIFAVRTHPDLPRSTAGVFDPLLASETTKHSAHQASINLQGHHNWDRRFHFINARLPSRLIAQEVCAESWPGQSLVDAAEECVDSWRQSSGHWSAVSAYQPRYGYDMKLGRNGVWYATGIFARR